MQDYTGDALTSYYNNARLIKTLKPNPSPLLCILTYMQCISYQLPWQQAHCCIFPDNNLMDVSPPQHKRDAK